jgi:aspartate racemase
MSWESTVPYYRLINQTVQLRLGGLHSARVVHYSVDFHEIERLQHEGRWDEAGAILAAAASSLFDTTAIHARSAADFALDGLGRNP